jgi:YesN/AraC family two-component response regulator
LVFAEKSLQTAKKLNSPNRIPAAYKILYLINKQKGNNKEALHYFEIYNAYDDSVNSQKRRSEIMQLLADYEYLKKKNEIKLLKANNELNKHIIEIQRARMRFVITIGVFILIISIVFVILWYNKRKSYLEILKKTLELEAQKEITKDTAVRQNEVDERDMEIIGKWKEKVVEKKAYLDPDFSMDTASEILETNRSYLSKALNHYYDKNFKALINEYRIREACSLLKDKDNRKYTLEAIAGRSGFKNNVSFTAAFKKYTGLTPGFFRDHAPKIIDAQKQEEE